MMSETYVYLSFSATDYEYVINMEVFTALKQWPNLTFKLNQTFKP
jgi:hypothetical protein